MKIGDMDILSRWISEIKFNQSTKSWVAKIYPDKTIEAMDFQSLAEMIAESIARDVVGLVTDVLEISTEGVIYPTNRQFGFTDARIICTHILRSNFEFSYRLVLMAMHYRSNQSIKHAENAIESSYIIQEKRKKVYKAYPYLKNPDLPLK